MNGPKAGPSTTVRRSTRATIGAATNSSGSTSSLPLPSIGEKRKTRSTSIDVEKEFTTPKRPALSSAFSTHIAQSSLNRQLLATQSQLTELQNALLEKQATIDRIESDRRLLAASEEEHKGERKRCETELASQREHYEEALSTLKKRFSALEVQHEELDDAYSQLNHSSDSEISKLKTLLVARDQEVVLLKAQKDDAEERARVGQGRIEELEAILRQMGVDLDEIDEIDEISFDNEDDEKINYAQDDPLAREDYEQEHNLERNRKQMNREREQDSHEAHSVKDDGSNTDEDADGDDEADMSFTAGLASSIVRSSSAAPHDTDAGAQSPRESSQPDNFAETVPMELYVDTSAPPMLTPASFSVASSRSTSVATSARMRSRSNSYTTSHIEHSTSVLEAGTPHADALSRIRSRLSNVSRSSNRRRSSFALALSFAHDREKDEEDRKRQKEDNEIIRAQLTQTNTYLKTLEADKLRLSNELTRAKARADGAEILREEKRELEKRVENMERLRTRVVELEETIDKLKERENERETRLVQKFAKTAEDSDLSKVPASVAQQLASIRKSHASLLDEYGQLKATLRIRDLEFAEARTELDKNKAELEQTCQSVIRLQDMLARNEKDRALLERNVTFLKSLVTSYKAEESSLRATKDEEPSNQAALEQQIQELEALLSEYRATILTLEKEADKKSEVLISAKSQEQWNQLSEKARILEEAFENASKTASRNGDRVEELEQRLFELGGEIGSGRHIPPGTRVLALRQNPAQEWADTRKEVLDKLKEENEALLVRLKDLEENGVRADFADKQQQGEGDHELFVPRQSWEALRHEKNELEEIVKQKEKRLLRLQQVFTAKSAEFREAVESVLGLKFAFYPNGQVRLTSIYDLSAAFVFQPSKAEGDAKMQLIATGQAAPQEIEQLMQYWVLQEMNIPCFMASVTLECYDKVRRERDARMQS